MKEHFIPENQLKTLCDQIPGDFGLYVSIPEEGKKYVLNGSRQFYSASTIKIPMLALLFQDAEDGRVNLDECRIVSDANCVGGAGILQSLDPNLRISVFDLAVLMIVLSDNRATNEILDVVGMDRLRKFCREKGCEDTWIWRKMMSETPSAAQNPKGTPPNATTAADLGFLMEQIASGTMVSPEADRKMVQIMAGQQLGKLKKLLPAVTRRNPREASLVLPEEEQVVVACKGGSLESLGVLHDAGIFYLPDGRYYVMTVCTMSSDMAAAEEVIGRMGLAMYEAMK